MEVEGCGTVKVDEEKLADQNQAAGNAIGQSLIYSKEEAVRQVCKDCKLLKNRACSPEADRVGEDGSYRVYPRFTKKT